MALDPENSGDAILQDGMALANLHQDDAARSRFKQFLATGKPGPVLAIRVERYAKQPELARERMAPAFQLTTLSGQKIELDDLDGKVLLVDFWATWCGPCREALPHMQRIAQHFAGQPLIVLSVSLDKDEAKWREFVAKNHMDWEQYRDGDFTGALAQGFGVHAIPATFTIDPDGVVQDQHVGDADIEGKLKKLLQKARAASEAPRPVGD